MGNKCALEIAPEAIVFESEATLNKKRGSLKILHSVVVQPRFSALVEIVPRNFGDTIMFQAASAATAPPTSQNAPIRAKKKFLSKTKLPLSSRSSSGKTSLNSTTPSNKVRIGKPGLSVSYSWSDRRTARKQEEEKSKKKKKSKKKGKRRRRRRRRKKREKSSTSEEADTNSKSRSRKWKNLMTPRRRRKHNAKKKKQKQKQKNQKKKPPLPLYTNGGNYHTEPFPRNHHPVQIQFIEECPTAVDLCVVFNSNTAVREFPGVIDMSAKGYHHQQDPVTFRTTGGYRRVHRAADRSCFEFSNEISSQKKYYTHCFSVEFQAENVRYVSHFQETDRVVVLWAKEIRGLYHGSGGNEHQTVTNVPVLLCLPHHRHHRPHQFNRHQNDNVKEGIETMDLIICDAKSTAWSKNRNVQLFPVRQIKAADIQAYMHQAQRNDDDGQSSCSDADSLTRKKKRQVAAAAAAAGKRKIRPNHKKKKKRSRSRFGWLPRLRSLEKEVTQPAKVPQLSEEESVAFQLTPPPDMDLSYLRTISKGVHPALSSVENSPRGPFVLTDSCYSVSSSASPSISSSSSSESISQPSSPSGDTTVISHTGTSDDCTSGSSWFTDSQDSTSYEEDEDEDEEAAASSYIQLPKDSAGRIISDSIETASSISATSSAATSTSSSWNQSRSHHHHHRKKKKPPKKKVKIPILNLQATTTTTTSPLASPRTPTTLSMSQRDRLLQGIAQKMKKEIQKTENPHKTSPRIHFHELPLAKINVDQETTETSSASKQDVCYNALLSPRNEISPRLCKQHREEIMKQAQQKKDGHVVTSLDDAETIGEMVKQQQRENLVDLLNRKEAKKLEKGPGKKIKKLGRALSHRRLSAPKTPTITKGRGKLLTRQNSTRNNTTFLPSTLYASHNWLPVRSTKVKTPTTKEVLKKQ